MDRASFLKRMGLIAATPVMVGWTRSLEGVWRPWETRIAMGSPLSADEGLHSFSEAESERWKPIRLASQNFNHEDLEGFMRDIRRHREGLYVNDALVPFSR